MVHSGDEQKLWCRLRERNDGEARQLLFAKYSLWARSIARDVYRRVRIPQLDWGDYSQNAVIGLLEAMGRYDPNRGIDFIAYAKPRVRGAVFNGLRAFLSENSGRIAAPEARQNERYGSLHELDQGDELTRFVSLVSGLAVGHLLDSLSESEAFETTARMEHQIDAHRTAARLRDAIRKLPEKEELVIILHYMQHVPFTEIAKLIGVTKGRISQIHKTAINRLRSSSLLEDCRDAV